MVFQKLNAIQRLLLDDLRIDDVAADDQGVSIFDRRKRVGLCGVLLELRELVARFLQFAFLEIQHPPVSKPIALTKGSFESTPSARRSRTAGVRRVFKRAPILF